MVIMKGELTTPLKKPLDKKGLGNSKVAIPLPVEIWIFIVLALLAALFMTPSLLIKAGIMKFSLQSADELTASMALWTVHFARLFCLLAAFVMLITICYWRRIQFCSLCQRIQATSDEHIQNVLRKKDYLSYLWLASVLIAFVYIFLSGSLFSERVRRLVNKEDGVIESLTALLFFLASCISALNLRRATSRRTRIWLILMALGFFACSGEEISWGQRILGYGTPDSVMALNVQGEFNIHNMFGYVSDHVFIMSVFAVGCLLPFLCLRIGLLSKLIALLGMPLASIRLAVGFGIASLAFHTWSLFRFLPNTSGVRLPEVRELLVSVCLLVLVVDFISWQEKNSAQDVAVEHD